MIVTPRDHVLIDNIEAVLETGLVKLNDTVAALLFALHHNVQMPCTCRTPDGDEYEVSDPSMDETGRNPVPTFYWSPVK
jgi:hypothetical protein